MASDAKGITFLSVPPAREAAETSLLPELRRWFLSVHGEPTPVQRHAWPTIAQNQHVLLSAPTGSGKTLAAFMPILSRILAQPQPGLHCLYVAPLKALGQDVRNNLKQAWRSIQETGHFHGVELRIGLRTGDTSHRVRRHQLSHPPAILLTTPESLSQLLTHAAAHALFARLRWLIVDEIHALAGNKRGADLALSMERLAALHPGEGGCQRIGLSATCAPLSTIAEFLVGTDRDCTVAQVQDRTKKHLLIEPLDETGDAAPGWLAKLVRRLDRELAQQRTTLIFTNTRNQAERLTWALRKRYPDRAEEIAVHHSSLSAARRRLVERSLKQGLRWVVVCSTSLELGIDIGTVDSVVLVHPPGGVVRMLQRVGRSGHRPGQPRRGLLLAASAGELLESAVTAGSGRAGQIESVRILAHPLDVLCQHLVGMAMSGIWSPTAAHDLVRRAAPYRHLTRADFQDCLDYLSGQLSDGTSWLPARLHWEDGCFTMADPSLAKLLRRNLGSILTEDTCAIRLRKVAEGEEEPRTLSVGKIDQLYAEQLKPGDRFVLDGRCLELVRREPSALLVDEVFGLPQTPRWLGTGVPMPVELARRIYLFRVQAAEALRDGDAALAALLRHEFHLNQPALTLLRDYLLRQETVSEIPTLPHLLIECVSMQSCLEYYVHTPLPRRANEVLARVLVQRWQQRRLPAVMAVAGDLGLYLMASTSEPLLPDQWRASLCGEQLAEDFQTHLDQGNLVREHFGRVAQTGLMVLRHPQGRKRKVGGNDWTARRLYEQIRARVPDFILLRQTEKEAKEGLCDLPAAQAFADQVPSLTIRLRHLAQPSPLGEDLLRFGLQSPPVTTQRY